MGCGCGGQKWQAPANMQEIRAARKAKTTETRTRELIPGGYWNGPQAKKTTTTSK